MLNNFISIIKNVKNYIKKMIGTHSDYSLKVNNKLLKDIEEVIKIDKKEHMLEPLKSGKKNNDFNKSNNHKKVNIKNIRIKNITNLLNEIYDRNNNEYIQKSNHKYFEGIFDIRNNVEGNKLRDTKLKKKLQHIMTSIYDNDNRSEMSIYDDDNRNTHKVIPNPNIIYLENNKNDNNNNDQDSYTNIYDLYRTKLNKININNKIIKTENFVIKNKKRIKNKINKVDYFNIIDKKDYIGNTWYNNIRINNVEYFQIINENPQNRRNRRSEKNTQINKDYETISFNHNNNTLKKTHEKNFTIYKQIIKYKDKNDNNNIFEITKENNFILYKTKKLKVNNKKPIKTKVPPENKNKKKNIIKIQINLKDLINSDVKRKCMLSPRERYKELKPKNQEELKINKPMKFNLYEDY